MIIVKVYGHCYVGVQARVEDGPAVYDNVIFVERMIPSHVTLRRAAGESAPGTSKPTMTCGCHFQASTEIETPQPFLLFRSPF